MVTHCPSRSRWWVLSFHRQPSSWSKSWHWTAMLIKRGADVFTKVWALNWSWRLLSGDTEAPGFRHAVFKWGLLLFVGCWFLDRLHDEAVPVWLVPLENQLLPVWPLAENGWRVSGGWCHIWLLEVGDENLSERKGLVQKSSDTGSAQPQSLFPKV